MSRHPAQSVQNHPDLLHDESQLAGEADSVFFPREAAEVGDILSELTRLGTAVTVQGARTGIAGGAVPRGGAILNLCRMDRLLGLRLDAAGVPLLRVQPGLALDALRRWLLAPTAPPEVDPGDWHAFTRHRWRFTPDPTETSASIGGMVACNASGACSFLHGPTRRWIESLEVVLADGSRARLSRTQGPFAAGRDFVLEVGGVRGDRRGGTTRRLPGSLPPLAMPGGKHAAGYWLADDQPLIDLVIGSEGTLAVVVDIELRLHPCPGHRWGIHTMPPSEAQALALVESVRRLAGAARTGLGAPLAAIEYFDGGALALLRRAAAAGGLALDHAPPDDAACAVYFELEGDDAEALTTAAETLARQFAEAGGRDGRTWVASSPADLERLKAFRHAVPEAVNQIIASRRRDHPGLTKVGTDLAVPDAHLRDALAMYRDGLAQSGIEGVIFGHIGDNHLHVNLLPRDLAEHQLAKALAGTWAGRCVQWGGTVSAEHGIGKLKTGLLDTLYGAAGVDGMRRIKAVFDPAGRLNPGTLFVVRGAC